MSAWVCVKNPRRRCSPSDWSQCLPPNRWQRRGSSHYSVSFAWVYLSEVSILFGRREVIQRMKRILGLKIIYKGTGNGSVSIADRRGRGRGSGWCAGGGRRGLASARDI